MLEKQHEILIDITTQLHSNKAGNGQKSSDFSMLPKFPLDTAVAVITFDKNLSHPKLKSQFVSLFI